MIRVLDPAKLGQALAGLRTMLGISRREMARSIAAKTGRDAESLIGQLFKWDTGRNVPYGASLTVLLDELDYDLMLAPRGGDRAEPRYRVGGSWGRTIIRIGTGPADEKGRRPDDEVVGLLDTPALAERAVAGLNGAEAPAPREDA